MNGVAAAVVSSALGGTAAALTRYVIGASDPVTLAAFRFGIGFLLIFPLALALRARWPRGRDWIGVALLGIAFFAFFFFLYNLAMRHTSAARGSLALATLPLTTMLLAAFLGKESLSKRKFAGVLTAVSGVVIALWGGLAEAPQGAWRGDLVMLGATVVMALYSIWSRPFMARSSMLGFLAAGMGFGALASVALSFFTGGYLLIEKLNSQQWLAILCLGVFGGAAAFYLWVYALERTTPTRVTNTMTVNPVSASLLAAVLVGEPLGLPLALGIVAVGAGIWLASSTPR